MLPVRCERREAQGAHTIRKRRSVHGGGSSTELCIVELVKFLDGCDGGEYQQILGPQPHADDGAVLLHQVVQNHCWVSPEDVNLEQKFPCGGPRWLSEALHLQSLENEVDHSEHGRTEEKLHDEVLRF